MVDQTSLCNLRVTLPCYLGSRAFLAVVLGESDSIAWQLSSPLLPYSIHESCRCSLTPSFRLQQQPIPSRSASKPVRVQMRRENYAGAPWQSTRLLVYRPLTPALHDDTSAGDSGSAQYRHHEPSSTPSALHIFLTAAQLLHHCHIVRTCAE